MKHPVAVLISGSGSNLQALMDACAAPDYPARVALVISNKPNAYGVTRAKQAGIRTKIVSHTDYPTREAFDAALHTILASSGVEFVCLAGFMRILTPDFVKKWEGRMLNIHPSLLPKFPGLATHRRAIEAGEKEAGCTVHFVTEHMDAGPVILQQSVPVQPYDSPETLAKRVLAEEHRIYPQALRMVAEGKLAMRPLEKAGA